MSTRLKRTGIAMVTALAVSIGTLTWSLPASAMVVPESSLPSNRVVHARKYITVNGIKIIVATEFTYTVNSSTCEFTKIIFQVSTCPKTGTNKKMTVWWIGQNKADVYPGWTF
jgi:hypothetical protein